MILYCSAMQYISYKLFVEEMFMIFATSKKHFKKQKYCFNLTIFICTWTCREQNNCIHGIISSHLCEED